MKLRTSEYIIRETFFSLRRNNWMALASIGTVAVSLFVLGMFLMVVFNMNKMASALESQVQISVYLKDSVEERQVPQIEERLKNMQGISAVKFVPRDEALKRFRKHLGDQAHLLDALGKDNPLPNSFEVTVIQPELVKTAAESIKEMAGVETAKYGQDVIEHLFDITRLIRIAGVAIIAVLAGATLFIISNTIRLTVFARRKEVAIMKYVGATDWFIRWPFLLEGMSLGFFGSILASGFLYFGYGMITDKIYQTIAFFPLIPMQPFIIYISLVLLVVGMAIGAVGSAISLRRFLEA